MYNGQISSIGPRYCPSVEDKVVRFKERDSHHLFLEPEGRHTKEVYVNGLSTSLPLDVQDAVLGEIPALAKAHVRFEHHHLQISSGVREQRRE